MALQEKEKGAPQFMSFLTSNLFLALCALGVYIFFMRDVGVQRLSDINGWEFLLLTLAVFRMTRLFVYDNVAQFIRDAFLDKKEVKRNGKVYIQRMKPHGGFRLFMADLIHCPWCAGVWISVFSVFIYFYFPFTWFFWLVLAVAGVATFIQLVINGIGWQAEYNKLETQALEEATSAKLPREDRPSHKKNKNVCEGTCD